MTQRQHRLALISVLRAFELDAIGNLDPTVCGVLTKFFGRVVQALAHRELEMASAMCITAQRQEARRLRLSVKGLSASVNGI